MTTLQDIPDEIIEVISTLIDDKINNLNLVNKRFNSLCIHTSIPYDKIYLYANRSWCIKELTNVTNTLYLNMFKNLTHVNFSKNFNGNVDNLPPNLTHVTFGENFNQKINNWPSKVEYITFYGNYNKVISNLPLSIKEIKIYRGNRVYTYTLEFE